MEIAFKSPESGWRGRGRPKREPDPKVVKLLRQTAATNTVAVVTLDPQTSAADLRELRADLHAAQRLLGGLVHHQQVSGEFRFFWEP